MIRGLVLAGGEATRLPNKPLLPLKNGKPAITSGIDLLRHSGITHITVVVPPGSAIPSILDYTYVTNFKYVIQEAALGVPIAISQILPDDTFDFEDKLVVVFCDNVYSHGTKINDVNPVGHTVIEIAGEPIKSKSLSRWCGRWMSSPQGNVCVAGWMVLDRDSLQWAHHFQSTIDFLNKIEAQPIYIEDKGWWDIGTPSAYAAYWK